jgi:hypothetical protein
MIVAMQQKSPKSKFLPYNQDHAALQHKEPETVFTAQAPD